MLNRVKSSLIYTCHLCQSSEDLYFRHTAWTSIHRDGNLMRPFAVILVILRHRLR